MGKGSGFKFRRPDEIKSVENPFLRMRLGKWVIILKGI